MISKIAVRTNPPVWFKVTPSFAIQLLFIASSARNGQIVVDIHQVVRVAIVRLCLKDEGVVLHNIESNGPSTEEGVEVVVHGVDYHWHLVVGISLELACNLATFFHLNRLSVNQYFVTHRPFVLRVSLSDIHCQESNLLFECRVQ